MTFERKRTWVTLLAVLFVLITIWWLRPKPTMPTSLETGTSPDAESSNQSPRNVVTFPHEAEPSNARQPKQPTGQDRVQALKSDPIFDWKTPIEFYGKVVDEHAAPVPEASVTFLWTDLSREGSSQSKALSDGRGMFSLKGVRGKMLVIEIRKEGYYTSSKENQFTFEYANPYEKNYHEADPSKPVVFHLKRKGVSVGVVSRYIKVPLPNDGSPVRFDFLAGKVSEGGPLEVRSWKSAKDPATGLADWRVLLAVQGGGLAETTEEFPFLAPESGYTNAVELAFPQDQPERWQASVAKDYFVVFGEPPKYARIKFRTAAFGGIFYMEYWINPLGSRELEN